MRNIFCQKNAFLGWKSNFSIFDYTGFCVGYSETCVGCTSFCVAYTCSWIAITAVWPAGSLGASLLQLLCLSYLSNSNFKLGPSCTILGTQSQVALISTLPQISKLSKKLAALVALVMTKSLVDTVDILINYKSILAVWNLMGHFGNQRLVWLMVNSWLLVVSSWLLVR